MVRNACKLFYYLTIDGGNKIRKVSSIVSEAKIKLCPGHESFYYFTKEFEI